MSADLRSAALLPYAHLVPSTDVLSEILNDELVLLDMRSGEYFGLSPVASSFWMELEKGRSVMEARTVLLAEFEVSAEILDRDLIALITDLHFRGLLRHSPAASQPSLLQSLAQA